MLQPISYSSIQIANYRAFCFQVLYAREFQVSGVFSKGCENSQRRPRCCTSSEVGCNLLGVASKSIEVVLEVAFSCICFGRDSSGKYTDGRETERDRNYLSTETEINKRKLWPK